MTKANLTDKHSNLRRFFRTLANDRFSSQNTNIHIFLHKSVKNKKDIGAALKQITHRKANFCN